MIRSYLVVLIVIIILTNSAHAQEQARLTVEYKPAGGLVFIVQHEFHLQYGVAFPLTFQFDLPSGSNALKAMEKRSSTDPWIPMIEKNAGDIFNEDELVRFDYNNNRAYVSAAFGDNDSLFLAIFDGSGQPVSISYQGISRYYDNRRAVVTITADDWWSGANDQYYPVLLDIFRSYGLYVTAGPVTLACNPSTWANIQRQLDAGYLEITSHSRRHPPTPYADPIDEIQGSRDDILNNLTLPRHFYANDRQYVYCWIAPFGDYDETVDSLLGLYGYLAARLYTNLDTAAPRIYVYGDSTLHPWIPSRSHFEAFFPTVEFGAPSWGGGDTSLTSLNGLFDTITAQGGVYHLMWHPQIIYPDRNAPYIVNHLRHISRHTDLWYVNLGPLYLYHMVQEMNSSGTDAITINKNVPGIFELEQNYPNPFNPSTMINYHLAVQSRVRLSVYDIVGREVAVLVDNLQKAGSYSVKFDAGRIASGVYFCKLQAGGKTAIRKMIAVK